MTHDDVLTIHANTIEHEGGAPGLRDSGLLESAVLMPQQQFGGAFLHRSLAAMAAAYAFHITQNHAFIDGNKRTGALASLVFLSANGIQSLPDPDEMESAIMGVASGEWTKDQLTDWFQRHLADLL